jgi:hypothetical protein
VQLTELLGAVGSPVSTVKDQYDVNVALEAGQCHPISGEGSQREVGRHLPDLNPFEFDTGQLVSIDRPERDRFVHRPFI